MRIFRILGKSLSNAFKSIVRNFSLSLASISCTAITLMLVAIALLTTYNVNSMTENIEGSLTIIAFIDNSATDEEIENIKNSVNAIDNIDESKTIYRSKDEIKNELLQDEKIKDTLEALDTNPLSSTLVLSVKNVRKITSTANEVQKIEEEGPFHQSALYLIYKIKEMKEEDRVLLFVISSLLSSQSSSLLHKNLRDDGKLVYSTYSTTLSHNAVLITKALIHKNAKEEAIDRIKQTIEMLKNKEVIEPLLENIKERKRISLESIKDNHYGLVNEHQVI